MERLVGNPGIVCNRAKIASTVGNARCVADLRDESGSLADYLWQFVDGEPVVNRWRSLEDLPAETPLSRAMSRDLKHRGFCFVGPTTCYAFMQAVGMVDDHVTGCFRKGSM